MAAEDILWQSLHLTSLRAPVPSTTETLFAHLLVCNELPNRSLLQWMRGSSPLSRCRGSARFGLHLSISNVTMHKCDRLFIF